jgi:hypothetical protein
MKPLSFLIVLILSLLFLVALSTRMPAQSTDFFDDISRMSNIAEVQAYKQNFRLKPSHNDTLNLGVVQSNWVVHKGKRIQEIYLLTLSRDGQIFYREIYKSILNIDAGEWKSEQLHVSVDSTLLKNTLDNEMKINLDHLIRLPNRSTFGYACGGSAKMPQEGLTMLDLVDKLDSLQLEQWMKSINPIKQAYAYLGFGLLENKNSFRIPAHIRALMTDMEKTKMRIYSCSGCTIWTYVPINQLLAERAYHSLTEKK